MNLLYKLKLLYSKKMIGELLLIIQLVCVTAFAIYVVPPIVTYVENLNAFQQLYNEIDLDHAYFCNPSGAITFTEDEKQTGRMEVLWNKALKNNEHIDTILKCGITSIYFEDKQGNLSAARLITLPEEVVETFRLNMEDNEAEVFVGKGNKTVLQLVEKGKAIHTFYMEREGEIQLKVSGEITEEALPIIGPHGTNASIFSYVWFNVNEMDTPIIIVRENENLGEDVLWSPCYIILTDGEEEQEEFINELKEKLHDIENVRTLKDEVKESKEVLLTENGVFITRFMIFFLVSFFGYGGYIYLQGRKKRQTYAILEICGMSKKGIMAQVIRANVLVLIAGTMLGCLLHSIVIYVFTGYYYPLMRAIDLKTFAIVLVMYGIIYGIWQTLGFIPIFSQTVITEYKEERRE